MKPPTSKSQLEREIWERAFLIALDRCHLWNSIVDGPAPMSARIADAALAAWRERWGTAERRAREEAHQ